MLNDATIFRGAFWFAISALFERTMFFLLPIFIAPLGPANLGIFHLSLRIFQSIVSFPVKIINAKYAHKLRQYIQSPDGIQFEETTALLLKVNLAIGLLLGILLFIFILVFVPFKAFAFLAIALPFAAVNSYLIFLLRLVQRFKQIFFIQGVFIFLFQILYMIIFIGFFKMGIAAAFAGQMIVSVLISIAACFFIFDRINLLGFFNKISLKMLKISLLSFANVVFTTVSPIIDIVLVGILFGFSTLGHYFVLLYLPLLIHNIPTKLFAMFIHVAVVKNRADEDITQISKRVFKWILLITIPAFIVILIYPSIILSLFFHKSYVKDIGITQILIVSFFFQSFSWTAGRILLAKKKIAIYAATNYGSLFVFIILSLSLASSLGLFCIAAAFLISSILDAFLKCIFVVKKTKVLFIGKDHLKILSCGFISGIISYVSFFNNPLLFIPFFLILNFAILWMMRIINLHTFFDIKRMLVKEVALVESNE